MPRNVAEACIVRFCAYKHRLSHAVVKKLFERISHIHNSYVMRMARLRREYAERMSLLFALAQTM
jgi:hypothetical protein